MNYQQIICQATNKEIKADQVYKIRNDETSIENIASICYSCPYANSKMHACKNCHGTIAQNSIRKMSDKPGVKKIEMINYRNTFELCGEEYMDIMQADEFMNQIDIVANLNNSNWNHGQKVADRLRAYLPPKTAKTDCHNCKIRCQQQGVLTPCQKAKEYIENETKTSIENISSKQLIKINLPIDCICKEQVQVMIEV